MRHDWLKSFSTFLIFLGVFVAFLAVLAFIGGL